MDDFGEKNAYCNLFLKHRAFTGLLQKACIFLIREEDFALRSFGHGAVLIQRNYRGRCWFLRSEGNSSGYGNRIGIECCECNGIAFTCEVFAVEVIAVGSIYDVKA